MARLPFALSRVVTPADIAEVAGWLGVALPRRGPNNEPPPPEEVSAGEYYLLPLAIELMCAPLPGEWREVFEGGRWRFREGATGKTVDEHPLAESYLQLVALERRRKRPRMRYPGWLHAAAERMVQFVTPAGDPYTFDFGGVHPAPGLPTVVGTALLGDTDETAFAAGDARAVRASKEHGAAAAAELTQEEAAAAAVVAHAQGEQALAAAARERALANSQFGKLLGKTLHERMMMASAEEAEGHLRERLHAALRHTFRPLLGAALAAAPRQLRSTFDVAQALGIDIVREPGYLWLADLALSLPTPIGWWVADPGVPGRPSFWHNELTATSQWQNPVDELIKGLLQALRQPMNPRSASLLKVLLGEQGATPP